MTVSSSCASQKPRTILDSALPYFSPSSLSLRCANFVLHVFWECLLLSFPITTTLDKATILSPVDYPSRLLAGLFPSVLHPSTRMHMHKHTHSLKSHQGYKIPSFKLLGGIPFLVFWKSDSLATCVRPYLLFHFLAHQLPTASALPHLLLLQLQDFLSSAAGRTLHPSHQAFAAFHPSLHLRHTTPFT